MRKNQSLLLCDELAIVPRSEKEKREIVSDIYHVTNLRHENTAGASKIFYGNYYICVISYYMHHLIFEGIAQYEYLKTKIPDLKIVFVSDTGSIPYFFGRDKITMENYFFLLDFMVSNKFDTEKFSNAALDNFQNVEPGPVEFIKDIIKLYSNEEYIYVLDNFDFLFKNVYFSYFETSYLNIDKFKDDFWNKNLPWVNGFFSPESSVFSENNYAFPYNGINYYGMNGYHSIKSFLGLIKIEVEGFLQLKNNVLKMLAKDDNNPKKIYISRTDANKRHVRLSEEYYVNNRVYKEEDKIEKFYEDQGYTILNFEGMPLLDQWSYMVNATHVAGLMGTGLLNTLICDPSTYIVEIQAHPNYSWSFQPHFHYLGMKNAALVSAKDYNGDIVVDRLKYFYSIKPEFL